MMSRFWNLPPETQSILVAITGTVAGTIISNIISTKKVMKTIIIVLVLAMGIGIRIAAQKHFGNHSDFSSSLFDNYNGITVSNRRL